MKKLLMLMILMLAVTTSAYAQENDQLYVMGSGSILYPGGIQLPYWIVSSAQGIKIVVLPCYDFFRDAQGKPKVTLTSFETGGPLFKKGADGKILKNADGTLMKYDALSFANDVAEEIIPPDKKVRITIELEVLNFSDLAREIISSYVVRELCKNVPDLEKESKRRNWVVVVEIATPEKFLLAAQDTDFKDVKFTIDRPSSTQKIYLQGGVEARVITSLLLGEMVFAPELEIKRYEVGKVKMVRVKDMQDAMDNYYRESGAGSFKISYKDGTVTQDALLTRQCELDIRARKLFHDNITIEGDAKYLNYVDKVIDNLQKEGYTCFQAAEQEWDRIMTGFIQKPAELNKPDVLETLKVAAEKDELNETLSEKMRQIGKSMERDFGGKATIPIGKFLVSPEGKVGLKGNTSEQFSDKDFRKRTARELLDLQEKGCFTIPRDTDLRIITNARLDSLFKTIWQLYINEGLKVYSQTANTFTSGTPVGRISEEEIKEVLRKFLKTYLIRESELEVTIKEWTDKKTEYPKKLETLKKQLAGIQREIAPYPDPEWQMKNWTARAEEAENQRLAHEREGARIWREIGELLPGQRDRPDLHAAAAHELGESRAAEARRDDFRSKIAALKNLFDTQKNLEPEIGKMERNRESILSQYDASLENLKAELQQIKTKIESTQEMGKFTDAEITELRKKAIGK